MQPDVPERRFDRVRGLYSIWSPALLLFAVACGGSTPVATPEDPGPSDPPGNPRPSPAEVAVSIEWDGDLVLWGAPVPLRAEVANLPAEAEIEWRSLDDHYLSQPVVLGAGAEISTAALKPGRTNVEAVVISGGVEVARSSVAVDVAYRDRWNVALLAQHPLNVSTVGDIWVENGNALVARRGEGGISILSIDGGLAEIGRFTLDGLFTQDVKAADGIAYVSHEGNGHPNSVTIVDVSNPASPTLIGAIPRTETPSAHNLWIDGTTLYVASSSGTRSVHAYDVSDPANPRLTARLASTNGVAHDMHARDGIVYGAYLPLSQGQIGELVIASGEGTSPLSFTTYPGAFTHSSWLSESGRYLYVLDEVVNAPVRIYDVSDPTAPVEVGRYQPRVGTIPHQLEVVDGERAYLAHYKHGVEVLDVSDPVRPRLIGFFDTLPGEQADSGLTGIGSASLSLSHEKDEQGLFDGAWGAHWTDDGRFVVSDMASGVYLLRYSPGS